MPIIWTCIFKGGIVAKGVLLQPNVNVTQLNTIIMLATPHTAALLLDSSIAAYYQKLLVSERIFRESKAIAISVGGGPRDVVVSSNQVIDRTADLNILTTHIPGVWKSTDHLSILWCKEFVIVMVRALFDSVDISGRYPRISSEKEHRLKVLEYHLLQVSHLLQLIIRISRFLELSVKSFFVQFFIIVFFSPKFILFAWKLRKIEKSGSVEQSYGLWVMKTNEVYNKLLVLEREVIIIRPKIKN